MFKKSLTLLVTFLFFFSFMGLSLSFAGIFGSHKKIKAVSGELVIPVEKVNDGKAHYFSYKEKGQEVKFFVVKSPDGVIRAAFDACDVCFHAKKGYVQEGEFMLCKHCGRKFHSNRINLVEGGCNPAPLNRVVRDGNLVITVPDVMLGAKYF